MKKIDNDINFMRFGEIIIVPFFVWGREQVGLSLDFNKAGSEIYT